LNPADLNDGLVHIAIVALAVVVLVISFLAYLRMKNARYLFLTLAFTFLFLSQIVSLIEVLFLSNLYVVVPIFGIHLSHLFDLLTLLSFAAALIKGWNQPIRRPSRI
jgi:NADH:ubiquinone oxidoreductase subunit 6 (subunit J)